MNARTWMRHGILATALLLGAAVSGVEAAPCIAIDGRLDSASPISERVRPGCRYFTYRVKLSADEPIVFELTSANFDAYLILMDANGTVIARDDNSAGGADARITFTSTTEAWYQVVVTTNRLGAMGGYTLTIRDADDDD